MSNQDLPLPNRFQETLKQAKTENDLKSLYNAYAAEIASAGEVDRDRCRGIYRERLADLKRKAA